MREEKEDWRKDREEVKKEMKLKLRKMIVIERKEIEEVVWRKIIRVIYVLNMGDEMIEEKSIEGKRIED